MYTCEDCAPNRDHNNNHTAFYAYTWNDKQGRLSEVTLSVLFGTPYYTGVSKSKSVSVERQRNETTDSFMQRVNDFKESVHAEYFPNYSKDVIAYAFAHPNAD